MSSNTPLEGLLRPPVEAHSAFAALMGATVLTQAPSLFMMAPTVAYGSAAVLGVFAVHRLRQAVKVVAYQKTLKRLPYYAVTDDQIPHKGDNLFVGKGFRWGQKHTQRLKDTMHPRARKYVEDGKFFQWCRHNEKINPNSALAKLTKKNVWFNPVRPLPPIGGNRVLHAVGVQEEKDVFIEGNERPGNTLVLGQSRVGKTRLAEILIAQDIKRGDGPVIVFDPKSDAGLMARMYQAAVKEGREDDFYCFHLGFPALSARYNAVANFSRITEVATRIAGQLDGSGNGAAFKEFSWRFINCVARALVEMGERPDYNSILHYVQDIEPLFRRYAEHWLPMNADMSWQEDVNNFEEEATLQYKKNPKFAKHASPRTEALQRYVENMESHDPVMHGLLGALRYDRTFYEKLVASLIPLLEKLTTGQAGELLSPDYMDTDDDRPIFDFMQVIRRKGIVYIGLDALQDMVTASAVGNSMFSDLVSTIGSIYSHGYEQGMLEGTVGKKPKIYMHADELNELIGEEFLPMVNKASGGGLIFTGYTQSRSDIEASYGDAAKARVIESNFMNLIMMRVREKYTAEYLIDQLPEVDIQVVMTVSGATDSSNISNEVDFTSSTQDRITPTQVPMLDANAIMSLPKGQAFGLFNGGELYKLRMPLPADEDIPIPETMQRMMDGMKRKYVTSEQWWV